MKIMFDYILGLTEEVAGNIVNDDPKIQPKPYVTTSEIRVFRPRKLVHRDNELKPVPT